MSLFQKLNQREIRPMPSNSGPNRLYISIECDHSVTAKVTWNDSYFYQEKSEEEEGRNIHFPELFKIKDSNAMIKFLIRRSFALPVKNVYIHYQRPLDGETKEFSRLFNEQMIDLSGLQPFIIAFYEDALCLIKDVEIEKLRW